MATKKLSEALAALQAAASVSGQDARLVVAGQDESEKAQTITLAQLATTIPAATTDQAGVMSPSQVNALTQATTDITSLNSRVVEANTLATTAQRSANSASLAASSASLAASSASAAAEAAQSGVDALTPYTTTLQSYIVGELGSYDSAEAFDAALINMTKTTHPNGRYFAKVGDVPLFVTFEVLNHAANILCQWVEGAVTVGSNDKIITNITTGVRIISRVYSDGVWGKWKASALMGDLPEEQTDWHGYEGKYIYSHQSDPDRQVLNGNFKVINVSNGVEIQHRIWGATEYTDEVTKKYKIPIVNPSQYGVMNKDVFKRILYHTHYESGSTTTAVKIKYTNYETGGTNDLTISAASSAKAGVMTTDQYNQLKELSTWLRGSLGTFTSTDAFKTALANMPTTHKGKYGRYYAVLSGVTVYITFVLLEESSNTFAQWVEGTFIKSATDGDIYLNSELGVRLIGRVYHSTAWGLWRSTILDDELPLPASTTNDGLMSKEDKQLLEKIKTQLNL